MTNEQTKTRQSAPLTKVRAQPGSGAGARHDLVPWPQMLWVTWRQHRGLLVTVLTVFVVAVAAMAREGLKLHGDYATLVACHPAASPACQLLVNAFHTDWHQGNGIRVALIAAPLLLAPFAGPPVIASEMEAGTYRYAWTQGIGRVRWTLAKIAIVGSLVTVAALVLSQLFTWLFTPFLTTEQLTDLTPAVFDLEGLAYAAWVLTAFCLGTFLGALTRHVLPAMAATLLAFPALLGLTVLCLRNQHLVTTYWPLQLLQSACLLALCTLLTAATIHQVRHHAT